MRPSNKSLKSISWKMLALVLPLMVGCGGSELVNIELPPSTLERVPFEVTVDHAITNDFEPASTINAALIFASIVPESWDALSADYQTVIDGSPVDLEVTISSAPPENSPEFVEFLLSLLSSESGTDLGDLTCDASITVREGPDNTSALIATLFDASNSQDFAPHAATPFSLGAYAGGTVFLVSDVGSCQQPNGLIADNLVLSVGGGNLLTNPSFESNFDNWDLTASGDDCVNEVLGAGATTGGSGEWTTPLPTDGALLYASDADYPGQCIMSQEISVPGGAGAATLTGDVGAVVGGAIALFIEADLPELPLGSKVIWFRTDDIADFGDFQSGDTGSLNVRFAANEDSVEAQEVIILHGYYSELPEEIGGGIILPNASPAIPIRRPASSGAPAGEVSVVAPLASPGHVGAGIWFTDSNSGPQPLPLSISSSILVLQNAAAEAGRPIPALSGMMLILLSIGLGVMGVRQKKRALK